MLGYCGLFTFQASCHAIGPKKQARWDSELDPGGLVLVGRRSHFLYRMTAR